jgi:transmembrane sensor
MWRRRSVIVDAAWRGWVESMNEEQIRTAIAEQAGEWFIANDEGSLDAQDSASLVAWLKTSPVHVEEFLAVSTIARDLKEAGTHPEFSLDAILARARAENDTGVEPRWSRIIGAVQSSVSRRWLPAAVTMAACSVLSIALFSLWDVRPIEHLPAPHGTAALHFETRHGEQLSRRLADNSLLHLDTDSAVTIRYGKTERLAVLTSGRAEFDVAHEPDRAFRVIAGSAEVIDLGTKFDVRLEHDSTVVTVVEGRVAVWPSSEKSSANWSQNHAPGFVQLGADQQLRVTGGEWPATPVTVDAQSATAWLHREIEFNHEPLERVAAEFNRYAPKPIEIVTPALRNLPISGVFATDDTEAFIAFLRSLKGVRVEVTEARIRVSRD